ncbi:MAG: DUF2269 family protein [Solirubrobacteraceae bacterium]
MLISTKVGPWRGTVYNVAFFFHIVGVLLFVAGIALAGGAFETASRRSSPSEVAAVLSLARAGAILVAVGSVLIVAFGLWLVDLGNWHYDSFWVDASIVMLVTALAAGAMGGQRPKQARLLAASLAAEKVTESDQLRTLLQHRPSRWQNYLSLALVVAIVALMCFKP